MSTTRLTRALEELQAQLAAAGQDYHPEWDSADGVIVVRIADEQGPLPVGAFAARIAAARHDQELLLSDIRAAHPRGRAADQAGPADPRPDRRRQGPDPPDEHRDAGRGRCPRARPSASSWQLADALDDEQRAVCALLDADAVPAGPDALSQDARRTSPRRSRRPGPGTASCRTGNCSRQVLDYRRWRQFVFQLAGPEGARRR